MGSTRVSVSADQAGYSAPVSTSPVQQRLEDAIVRSDPGEIDAALRAGASLTGERCWPLKLSVEFDALASMNHLLSIGHTMRAEWPQLDYCFREDMRDTALHDAAVHNCPSMVRLLLEADGKDFINVAGDAFTAVPLALAAMVGAVEIVNILLAAGADVNARNDDYAGSTALDYAVERDRFDIASKLLAAGADPDIPTWMWMSARDRSHMPKTNPAIRALITTVPFKSHRLPDGRWTKPHATPDDAV
jgi:hypothetical protein